MPNDRPASWMARYGGVYGRDFSSGRMKEAGLIIELWLEGLPSSLARRTLDFDCGRPVRVLPLDANAVERLVAGTVTRNGQAAGVASSMTIE